MVFVNRHNWYVIMVFIKFSAKSRPSGEPTGRRHEKEATQNEMQSQTWNCGNHKLETGLKMQVATWQGS